MLEQSDVLPLDLDLEAIQARARADARRIREAYARRGRRQASDTASSDTLARAHLDALRDLLRAPTKTTAGAP